MNTDNFEKAQPIIDKKMLRAAINMLVYMALILAIFVLQRKLPNIPKNTKFEAVDVAVLLLNINLFIAEIAFALLFIRNAMDVVFAMATRPSNMNYLKFTSFGPTIEEIMKNTNNISTTVRPSNHTETKENNSTSKKDKSVKIICKHCNGVKTRGEACPYCGITE